LKPLERKILELQEYSPARFSPVDVPREFGEILWRQYNKQVSVEPPSFRTDNQWELTSQGWVGYIPLTDDFGIALRPKVKIANLFRMLELAYNLKSFKFLEGLVDCQSLEEFYERLANILAKLVLERERRGLYRAYLPESDDLPYIRGCMDIQHTLRTQWKVKIRCHYQEHTADLEENRILAWTLFCIARTKLCSEETLPIVRKAYRGLQGHVSMIPHGPEACWGRQYNRLNNDYQPMHALCRFFLEHSGPSHESGDRRMLPFLVNMAQLYELFVARWLDANLPGHLDLQIKERIEIGEGNTFKFEIDLVLKDRTTGETLCVLDTKYKAPDKPAYSDIFQIVTYAEAKGCTDAILIYPSKLERPMNEQIGNIKVRSLTFSLSDDLDESGQLLISNIQSTDSGGQKG